MATMEKIRECMQLDEEKKKDMRKSILTLMLEWKNFEKDLEVSTTSLREYVDELNAKEKRLTSVQESLAVSCKEIEQIRESLERKREEAERKEKEFHAFREREFRDVECKWKEFDTVRKEYDEVVKLREEKLNEQGKMVERIWGEIELERKQLEEDLGKYVNNRFKQISVKEEELEKRSHKIREETDALHLKESEFTERVETFELKEKTLLMEIETKESGLDSLRKQLMDNENLLKKELRAKETKLQSAERELRENNHSLDSIRKLLSVKETTFDLVKKQLAIKEDQLSSAKEELELKDKNVDAIKKKLELQEVELTSLKKRLQLREGELSSIQKACSRKLEELDSRKKKLDSLSISMKKCESEFQFEKEKFQTEQELFKTRMEDIVLNEKRVEVKCRELNQREKHIEDRFKLLEEKEKQLKTICVAPVKTEPVDNVEIGSSSAEIRLFVTVDGKKLQIYLNEHEKVLDSMRDDVFDALQLSPNPGQLVLDAMVGFYPPHLRNKGDTEFEESVARKSCIFLLEQLIRLSPKIQAVVRKAAMELAQEWKTKMTGNHLEILGFLYLLASYNLISAFDADELMSLLAHIVVHNKSKDLCRLLGFTEKISCYIQGLIAKHQHLEAVKFAYAFELVDRFAPIPILKDYLKQVMQILETVDMCSLEEEENKTIEECIASIRAIVKCIVDHELQSEYSPTELEECIESLIRQKADAVTTSSEAPKPQQTQMDLTDASISVGFTCKLNHSDAFAVILVAMGGKNLQTLLNDHSEELELLRVEVSGALKLSTDSGMLVLEALSGFYPPHKEEDAKFHPTSIIRKSCIFLLEELLRITPNITPKAKVEASRLAFDWKAKMTAEGENHQAILGFLFLVSAFGLASADDKNELESLCCTGAHDGKVTEIFRALGISAPGSHSHLSNNLDWRSKRRDSFFGCAISVVHRTSHPAKMVLDALRKCYSAEKDKPKDVAIKKRKRAKSATRRFADLLEQLREMSPEITPQLKVEATEFAVEWRTTLSGSRDVLGFLFLIATFDLSSSFDLDDLVSLLEILLDTEVAIDLIKKLGLADKIPGFIDNLIRRREWLPAFKYMYECGVAELFSPVALLKNHVASETELAKQMCRNGRCTWETREQAIICEISALKAAVKRIVLHNLQSEYSPDPLRARISKLERQVATLRIPNIVAKSQFGARSKVVAKDIVAKAKRKQRKLQQSKEVPLADCQLSDDIESTDQCDDAQIVQSVPSPTADGAISSKPAPVCASSQAQLASCQSTTTSSNSAPVRASSLAQLASSQPATASNPALVHASSQAQVESCQPIGTTCSKPVPVHTSSQAQLESRQPTVSTCSKPEPVHASSQAQLAVHQPASSSSKPAPVYESSQGSSTHAHLQTPQSVYSYQPSGDGSYAGMYYNFGEQYVTHAAVDGTNAFLERPHESPYAPIPHALIGSTVIPNSAYFPQQHVASDARVGVPDFRPPNLPLHPGQFMQQHYRLDAPVGGGMVRNYPVPNDHHYIVHSGVSRPFLPPVNPLYHQQCPPRPNMMHPSYFG